MSYPPAFPDGLGEVYVPPLQRKAEVRLSETDGLFSVVLDGTLDLGFIVSLPKDRLVPLSPSGVSYGLRADFTHCVSVLIAAEFPQAFDVTPQSGAEGGR